MSRLATARARLTTPAMTEYNSSKEQPSVAAVSNTNVTETQEYQPTKLTPNKIVEIFGDGPEIREIVKNNIRDIYPRWKQYRDYRRQMQDFINRQPDTTPMMQLKAMWRIKYGVEIPGHDMSPRQLWGMFVWHFLWRQEDEHKRDSKTLRMLKQVQDIINRGPQPEQSISAEEVKARVDLVAYVEAYTELKQRGNRHLGRCPMPEHNEKTPSFVVYEGGRGWYCYGCHAGGSVIDFVMKIEGVSFSQAIQILNSHT